ncbi:hypothetical protein KSP40_PGU015417 [Platanthera guangdongensis]|uniref:Methyltransferase domain-containing protein n=1 Tax=Platanthera guangdongensis TaxID=2320717 RepID=A0ABR2MKC2_9ASPA
MPRPEFQAPPEIFYNDSEARKYTTSSRIIEIQSKILERALELLNLPNDGVPRLLLDIGCGSGISGETLSENEHHWIGFDISQSMLDVALEREVEGDLLLADMGQAEKSIVGVLEGLTHGLVGAIGNDGKGVNGNMLSSGCDTGFTRVIIVADSQCSGVEGASG